MRQLINRILKYLPSIMLTASFLSPFMISGCAARVSTGYRVYDPYYPGYYRAWDNDDSDFYVRWENDTHRKHEDFRRRSSDEQKEYFNWRHDHH